MVADWVPVQGATPPVALLASKGTDDLVADKGFLSVSQLLAPFASTTVSIRDPSTGVPSSTRITLDFRDIRKDGYLLSLTVLPHILHEALSSYPTVDESLCSFNDSLSRWMEPAEQETFRSYLSCLFFVSTRDENPLAELSQLIQIQHTQQHSSTTTDVPPLAPSHCARPLWTTPTTLKHYCIVYEAHDEQRARDLFSQMCSTYGIEQCSQLKLDSPSTAGTTPEDESSPSDLWVSAMGSRRILEVGLGRARKELAEKTASGKAPTKQVQTPSTPSLGITTISSSYSISSAASASPSSSSPPPLPPPPRVGRRNASLADRDACTRLVEEYARNNLVPHAERLLRTLNDQLANRRGISRSLTSGMRKWFGGAGGGGGGGAGGAGGGAAITYAAEAPEMQMRRLADISFLFGLFPFAHSQYQAVKKEFAVDQAWLHHAMALEMSAASLHAAQPQLTHKQFPVHYVENAISGLLQNGARWPSLLRAGLNAYRIFTHLEMYVEAAGQLVRLTGIENDACVAVILWLAASSFERAKMHRKTAFYRYLAGHRFGKAGLSELALYAHSTAYHEYIGKGWWQAEERLAWEVSSIPAEGEGTIEAAERLLGHSEEAIEKRRRRTAEETAEQLAHYGRTRTRVAGASRHVPVPVVDVNETRVVCGERPLTQEVASAVGGAAAEEWVEMERTAYHAVAGTSSAFRPTHVISDADTDNQKVRETPSGERFRVQLRLRNPLVIPLTLRDVHLGVEDVKWKEGEKRRQNGDEERGEGVEGMEVARVDSVTLQPEENRMLELFVLPSSSLSEFRISSLRFRLLCAPGIEVPGEIELTVRGRRLNKTPKQMKSVVYATDERLRAHVSTRRWPLLDIKLTKQPPAMIYTDQLVEVHLEITNNGEEDVEGAALAVDVVDRVRVMEEEKGEGTGRGRECEARELMNTPGRRAFVVGGRIAVGHTKRIVVELRAPSSPIDDYALSMLLLYRGVDGALREWRTRRVFRALRLLHTATRVLDPYHGLVAVQLQNALRTQDAALARVECTRVRVAVAARVRGVALLQEERGLVALAVIGEGRVKLESGQTEELCLRISGRTEDGEGGKTDTVQLTSATAVELPPEWPLPIPEEHDDSIEWGRRRLLLAVAWKANVVGNDGHVTSLLGESFIADPFAAVGLHVSGLRLGSLLSSAGAVASPLPPTSDSSSSSTPSTPPVYLSALPVDPVEHDFTAKSICEIPITVVVRNEDPMGRTARVRMRFTPKARNAVGVAAPVRQQWWLSREQINLSLPSGTTKEILLKVRVTQPSAYDLLGSQMTSTVAFESSPDVFLDANEVSLNMPPALAVVYAATKRTSNA